MAQFRGFSGLRTYEFPLIRDLRELERYLEDLDERVAGMIEGETVTVTPPSGGQPSPIQTHARNHATKIDAATGTDPLDAWHMLWRKRQEIKPDLAVVTDVPLTIRASSSAQTADMLNVFDTVGAEQFTLTKTGIAAFSGADETARINVKAVAPTAVAPEDIGATPFIWFRADDVTGEADSSHQTTMPERSTINSFSQFSDGPAGGGSRPIVYLTADGTEPMNGHACVTQAGTDTDLSLNGVYDADEEGYNASVKMTGAFTCMFVYGYTAAGAENTNNEWMIGAGLGNGVVRSGLSAPQTHPSANNSAAWMQTISADGLDEYLTLVGAHTDTTDGIRIGIYRRTGNTVKYYGTVTDGDTQVSHSTNNSDLGHHIHFNGLLSDGDATCPGNVKLAELVLWRSYLSDTQVLQLYQWAAARFGLTALTGADDLLAGFTGADERVFAMDAAGKTSLSVSTDPITEPSVRLHVRDTAEQFRFEYDSTNYMSHTIASDGDVTITNATVGGGAMTYDHNFASSGSGLLYTISNPTGPLQLFLNSLSDSAIIFQDETNDKWRIRNDQGGSGEAHALVISVGGTTPVAMSLMPSGLVGVNTANPSAALHVLKTTEQLRLSADATSYASHTVTTAGLYTIQAFDSGSPLLTLANDTEIIGENNSNASTLLVKGVAGGATQLEVRGIAGGHTSDIVQVIIKPGELDEATALAVGATGDVLGMQDSANVDWVFRSFAAETVGGPSSFLWAQDTSITLTEPMRHSSWKDSSGTVLMQLRSDGNLYADENTTNLYLHEGNVVAALEPLSFAWTGSHSWSLRTEHDGGITLEADGTIHSDVVDGGIAFDLVDTVAKTSGTSFRLKNSADNKEILTIGYDGKLVLGYQSSISGITDTLMSFVYNDTNAGKLVVAGMAGSVVHANASLTLNTFAGVFGATDLQTSTGFTSSLQGGVFGTAACFLDEANFGGKVIASVVGLCTGTTTGIPNRPSIGGLYPPGEQVKGDWDFAATFWAEPMAPSRQGTFNNLPSVSCAYYGTIPENTTGESWMIYGDLFAQYYRSKHSKYAAPKAASVAGAMRLPWAEHGTRNTHLYFIPGDITASTGPAQGDVVFDDGTTAVGLHEYNGTAWKRLRGKTDKFWPLITPGAKSGTFYVGGYYDFASSDNDFNPSVNWGTANSSYAAHFMVVAAAGGSGGVDTVVRVTGTSITDGGTRTTSDTEDITMDDAGAADAYYETAKKWLGLVAVVKQSGPDLLCNYGWCKYWDDHNNDFTVTGLEALWFASASDSAPDIKLLHHKSTGWTYNAGSTPTPPTAIASMNTDHGTESEIINNDQGAWKRSSLNTAVAGSGDEGVVWEIVTTSNNAFDVGSLQLTIIED